MLKQTVTIVLVALVDFLCYGTGHLEHQKTHHTCCEGGHGAMKFTNQSSGHLIAFLKEVTPPCNRV